MKKFISFVMAAAMVASLVPATAFAKGEPKATVKVIDALDMTKIDANNGKYVINESQNEFKVPELQLTITTADYRETEDGAEPTTEVTVTLDNATFVKKNADAAPTGNPGDWADFVEIDRSYDGSDTAFTPSATGSVFQKAGKADILASSLRDLTGAAAIKAMMDPEKMATPLTATFTAGDLATTAPGSDVKITKGSEEIAVYHTNSGDPADTVVTGFVNGYNATRVVEKILDGYSFAVAGDKAAFTILCDGTYGDTTKTDIVAAIAAGSFTAANQMTELGDNTGAAGLQYTRGDYVKSVVGSTARLTSVKNVSEDQVTFVFTGKFQKDDVIIIDLFSKLDKTGEGRQATVSVNSKMVDANDLVYASVKARGISATTRKVGSIAEEEIINLETDIKVSSAIGDFADGQWFELKLSKGFEFNKVDISANSDYDARYFDGNTAYVRFSQGKAVDDDVMIIDSDDIEIESTSAKSGSTCTMTIKALDRRVTNADGDTDADVTNAFKATTTVEILKVVDYKVTLTVDEDEDVPVIYSGVNVDNYGITDDSDHMSLEVTAKETFPGAWSMRKGFNFELPEHVYVTDVKVVDTDNFYRQGKADSGTDDIQTEDVRAAFWNAYQDGKHVNFEFAKRVFDDVDSGLRDKECAEMTFQLELVADPGFEGDVALKLTGELVDEQEVVIAKFVKPYEVKAEQNDLKIDYRYTEIPTAITITEAEKGLWAKNEAEFFFSIEKEITFDSDPTFEIDSKSGLEIKDDKVSGGTIQFTVKSESDEAATVTIKDMDLFMQRNIPAGPYDLKINSSLAKYYNGQILWAPDDLGAATQDAHGASDVPNGTVPERTNHVLTNGDDDCDSVHTGVKADSYVGCVADYSTTVKEAFINVITAGREVDDASFTTKVVVPVGENYIVAGEKQIELDTPAYINEAGYTMLPIRAVATALGINNNNVLWDQPTKTVTILYGQRIITMTQGQKVVYVNGSAIPASAAVENTNSRTFLPMRDLATALGVTDITWDQATRTATLNGNQTTSAK